MKYFAKLIALIVAFGIVFSTIPCVAFAEGEKNVENDTSYSQEAYPLTELVNERTENSKRFLMSDKSIKAVVYSNAVHYSDNGKWQDIDNTLNAEDAQNSDDFNGYVNKKNDIKIKIAKNANAKKLISVRSDDSILCH